MPYSDKYGFPVEQASKISHMKTLNSPFIRQFVESFEQVSSGDTSVFPAKTGAVDLDGDSPIRRVITVDGGQAVVPHPMRREKAVAFIQVAACLLRMEDFHYMRDHPMMDPRDLSRMTEEKVWYNPSVIPLSGVRTHDLTVQQTIRRLVDATLAETNLYETLKYLVYREWEDDWNLPPDERPFMDCLNPGCDAVVRLPRGRLKFECSACKYPHYLSDYLSIGTSGAEDWAKEEAASALRDVMETLTLFYFIRKYHNEARLMRETLFIKDGPLLLRAALSRLVEPIRAFIVHIRDHGHPLHLVGVEKTGDLVAFLDEYQHQIPNPGDYFLPSVKFIMEEIAGAVMPAGYRNRVSYGAKVAFRAGRDHVFALNIPTGEFRLTPTPDDLIGFEPTVRSLSELVSYQYPNALVPLVLANASASIARRPSGDILKAFVDQLISS